MCFSFDNLVICQLIRENLVEALIFLIEVVIYFKRLKHVELLGSLNKGSRFLMVKNPLITLPIVSPVMEKLIN